MDNRRLLHFPPSSYTYMIPPVKRIIYSDEVRSQDETRQIEFSTIRSLYLLTSYVPNRNRNSNLIKGF